MKKQQRKKSCRRSDNVYITLGLLSRYGAALWMILVMTSINTLNRYGWTETTGGIIAEMILLFSIPTSWIITGLYYLLGGIFRWKGTLCAVQSMHREKKDPKGYWSPEYRRDMIIIGSLFIVLGIVLLLAWILGI